MRTEDAIRRLNGYLQRRGTVDGSGGWTEQWLLDILTDANLDMYHRIVNYGPEIFHTTSRFTYAANSESVDLKTFLGERPAAIWYTGTLGQDADVGPTNIPVPVSMVRRDSVDNGRGGSATLSGGSFLMTNTVPPTLTPIALSAATGVSALYEGFTLGDDFLLRPIPTNDIYVYMRWTPVEPPALSDPDDELLMGQMSQFHPAIVYKAAIAAKSAKGEDFSQLDRLYLESVGQYDSNLKLGCKQRQRQQPNQREPMRWEY
jgi:hypothetical protein